MGDRGKERRLAKVLAVAYILGRQGREDVKAVKELRRAAGRSRSSSRQRLTQAAYELSATPIADETDFGNRAYRLLRAAADGAAVERVTPERAEFLRQAEALQESPEATWDRMTQAQPALRDLEAHVTAIGATRPDNHYEAVNAWRKLLGERLPPLIGPDAASLTDPLLRTKIAYAIAARHLTRAYRLAPDNYALDEPARAPRSHQPGIGQSPERDPISLAWDFGVSGREDIEAVKELRSIAGRFRPRRRLTEAIAKLSTSHIKDETDFGNRAYRLLRAAADGAAVERVTPERAEFLRQAEALQESPEATWDRMTQAQPALRDLEAHVTAIGATRPDNHYEAVNAWRKLLGERLPPLIGPDAASLTDPLLRTKIAYAIAARHLTRAYGLSPRYAPTEPDYFLKRPGAVRVRRHSGNNRARR